MYIFTRQRELNPSSYTPTLLPNSFLRIYVSIVHTVKSPYISGVHTAPGMKARSLIAPTFPTVRLPRGLLYHPKLPSQTNLTLNEIEINFNFSCKNKKWSLNTLMFNSASNLRIKLHYFKCIAFVVAYQRCVLYFGDLKIVPHLNA